MGAASAENSHRRRALPDMGGGIRSPRQAKRGARRGGAGRGRGNTLFVGLFVCTAVRIYAVASTGQHVGQSLQRLLERQANNFSGGTAERARGSSAGDSVVSGDR